MRFAEEIKQVNVRAVGNERIISPITETWNSFFKNGVRASPDFMAVRELQEQAPREAL
jgi:antitoxin VapB